MYQNKYDISAPNFQRTFLPFKILQMESADTVTQNAHEKAANVSSEELQREILAQLYIQNQTSSEQKEFLKNIKGILVFHTIMYLIAIFTAIAFFGN